MTTKEIGSKLEKLIVAYLKEIDSTVRLTRASGAKCEKGDIANKLHLKIECKKRDSANCIIDRKWWLKLNKELNIYNQDIPILIFQNKYNECFTILDIKDFIRIFKGYYNESKRN